MTGSLHLIPPYDTNYVDVCERGLSFKTTDNLLRFLPDCMKSQLRTLKDKIKDLKYEPLPRTLEPEKSLERESSHARDKTPEHPHDLKAFEDEIIRKIKDTDLVVHNNMHASTRLTQYFVYCL